MLCPKCNCENVKIHREKMGNVSGKKGVYAKKKHGLFYWLFVGWWIWIPRMYSDILTLGYTWRKRKQNSMHQVGSYHQTADKLKSLWEEKRNHNADEQSYLDKIGAEISQMKEGSIALINQITTVSKMRIFDPRNLRGVLAGISLTEEGMEKINEKVKELYVF